MSSEKNENFGKRAVVDYRELSVTFGDIKLFVPKGLKKTLEKLCKAILTEKPRNIPRFCANYFLAQLAQRAEIDSERRFSYSQIDSNGKKISSTPPHTSTQSIKSLLGPSIPIADQIKSHKDKKASTAKASTARRETHENVYTPEEETASVSEPFRRNRTLPPKPSVSIEKHDSYDSRKGSRPSLVSDSGRFSKTRKANQVASSDRSDDEFERESRASSTDSFAGQHRKSFKEREKSRYSATSTSRKFSEEKWPPVTEFRKPSTKKDSRTLSANYGADSVKTNSGKIIRKESSAGYPGAFFAESRGSTAERISKIPLAETRTIDREKGSAVFAADSHKSSVERGGKKTSAASVEKSRKTEADKSSRILSAANAADIRKTSEEYASTMHSAASVAESHRPGAERDSRIPSAADSRGIATGREKGSATAIYSAPSVAESHELNAEKKSRKISAASGGESRKSSRGKASAAYSAVSFAESHGSANERKSRIPSAAESRRVSREKASAVYSAASVAESRASGAERTSRIPSVAESRRVSGEKSSAVHSESSVAESHKSEIRKDSRLPSVIPKVGKDSRAAAAVSVTKRSRAASSASVAAKGARQSSASTSAKSGKTSTGKSSRIHSAGSVAESGKKKGKGKKKQMKKKKSQAVSSSEKSEDDFPAKESRESSIVSSVDEQSKHDQEEILQDDSFFDSESENKAEYFKNLTKLSDKESTSAISEGKISDNLYVDQRIPPEKFSFDINYQGKPAVDCHENELVSDREGVLSMSRVDDDGKKHGDQEMDFKDDYETDFAAHETNLLAPDMVEKNLMNVSSDTIADVAPELAAHGDLDEVIEIISATNIPKDENAEVTGMEYKEVGAFLGIDMAISKAPKTQIEGLDILDVEDILDTSLSQVDSDQAKEELNAEFFETTKQDDEGVSNVAEEKITEPAPAHDYASKKVSPVDSFENLIPKLSLTNKGDVSINNILDNNNSEEDITEAQKEKNGKDVKEEDETIEKLDKIPSALEVQGSTPSNDVSTLDNLEQVVPKAESSHEFVKVGPAADQYHSINTDDNEGKKKAWQFNNVDADDPSTNNFNEKVSTKNGSAAEHIDEDDEKNLSAEEIFDDNDKDASAVENLNNEAKEFSGGNFSDVSENAVSPEKFDGVAQEPSTSDFDEFKNPSVKNFDDDDNIKDVSAIENIDDDTKKRSADNFDYDGMNAVADKTTKNDVKESSAGYFGNAKESFTSSIDVKKPFVGNLDVDNQNRKFSVSNFDDPYKEPSASNFDDDDAKELLAQNFGDDTREPSAYNFEELQKTSGSNSDDFKDESFDNNDNDNEAKDSPDTSIFDEGPEEGDATKPGDFNDGVKNASASDIFDDNDEDEFSSSF